MSVVASTPSEKNTVRKNSLLAAITRISRYIVFRLLSLFVTVVIGVYLTILIANMGG